MTEFPETIWASAPPRRCDVYHTDPECYRITRKNRERREISTTAAEFHDLEECPDCAGAEYKRGGSRAGAAEEADR